MSLGGATEHQGNGTPHFHGEGHIVCAYQYGTLADIVEKLDRREFTVDDIKRYHEWMHQEDIFDLAKYESYRPHVEEDWKHRFSGPEHNAMSVNPQYLAQDWQPTQVPAAETAQSDDVDAQSENVAQVPAAETTQSDNVDAQSENVAPMSEADLWRKEYLLDAQFVFSRVQHHVHKKSATRGYVPINTCKPKSKRQTLVCKANSP